LFESLSSHLPYTPIGLTHKVVALERLDLQHPLYALAIAVEILSCWYLAGPREDEAHLLPNL
jgi:hypothetical protein